MPRGEHNGNEIISLPRLRENIKVRPHKRASPSRSHRVARTPARTHCFGKESLWFHAIITTCSAKNYSDLGSCSYSGGKLRDPQSLSPPTNSGGIGAFPWVLSTASIYSPGDILTCRECRRSEPISWPILTPSFRSCKEELIFLETLITLWFTKTMVLFN